MYYILSCAFSGHSLVGALATLAALGIRRACPDAMVDVSCYVFGAPRTGNRAFAREYNTAVPDTWSVINDQVPGLRLQVQRLRLLVKLLAVIRPA